jgi:hypothetical protein
MADGVLLHVERFGVVAFRRQQVDQAGQLEEVIPPADVANLGARRRCMGGG